MEIFEKICQKVEDIKPAKIKSFIVMDEIVYGSVSMFYLNSEGEDCMWNIFSAFGYDNVVKLAVRLAEKYDAELII